jgi:uncharacterized protein YaaN involved in tellurite resistance
MPQEETTNAGLIASPTTKALVAAQTTEITPRPPEKLEPGEAETIADTASALVESFRKSPTDLRLAHKLGTLGVNTQFEATRKTKLLQVKLKPLVKATGNVGGAIPDGLDRMQKEVKKIDPQELMRTMQQGWIGMIVSKVSGNMKGVLTNIASSYDTAEETIDGIVTGLLTAKGGLYADNEELATVAGEVEECLVGIRKDAYQSELVFQGINSLPSANSGDQLVLQARTQILQRLVGRIVDLRTMENLLLQLSVQIRSIFNDNYDLADAIDRSATITRALLTVGLICAIALYKQKQTAQVVKGQRTYNVALLKSLASAAGMGAVEIAKLLEDPAMTFEGMKSAHEKLMTQLDRAQTIKNGRITKAKEVLPQLEKMSADLGNRLEGLKAILQLGEPDAETV